MVTNIFTGNTAAVSKVVWVGLPAGINIGSAEVSIGFGTRRIVNEGWNPTEIASAWSASTDALLATVLCEIPSGGATFGGLTSPLRFTHRTAGEDFQLSIDVDGGQLLVSNEVHNLLFSNNTTGGTFTLTVLGETTAAINYDADGDALALTIQAALETLTGVGIGDILVTHASGTFTFDYSSGVFEGQSVDLITVNDTNLNGSGPSVTVTQGQEGEAGQAEIDDITIIPQPVYGDASVTITTVTEGGPGQNTIYDIELYAGLTSGTFRLTINGTETADIEWDATAAEVKTEIDLILTGGETVTVTGGDLPGTIVTVEFTGDFADAPQVMSITNPALVGAPGITIDTTNEGGTLTALNDSMFSYFDFQNASLAEGSDDPYYQYMDRVNGEHALFREDESGLSIVRAGRHDNSVKLQNAVNDGLAAGTSVGLSGVANLFSRPRDWGFCLWVKPSDIETAQLNDQYIWDNDTNGSLRIIPGETNFTLTFRQSSPGQPNTDVSLVLDTATYLNEWIMITGTVGDDGHDVSLAINDEAFATTTAGVNDQINSGSRPLWLGGLDPDYAFSGTFDRFMWFTKTLTQDDVTALYNDGLGQGYPVQSNKEWANAVGYWPLGEGAGPRNDLIGALSSTGVGDGTLHLDSVSGANSVAGKNGDAVRLQNAEYVTSFNSNPLAGKVISARHGVSISFWFKFEAGAVTESSGTLAEFDMAADGPFGDTGTLTFSYLDSTDDFRFEYLGGSSGIQFTADFGIPGGTVDDTWYHFTLNAAGDANESLVATTDLGCFVDGVKQSSGYISMQNTGDHEANGIFSNAKLTNGGVKDGGGSCQFDELVVWSRCRLASQIVDHYNAGAGKFYSTANEIQTILTTGTAPTFGYIDITWDGNTTSEVPANATAQDIVDGMTAIGGSGISASGGPLPAMITITYGGAQGNTNQPEITAAFSNHQYRTEQTTLGFAAVDEVQRVVVDAAKGDFTLTHSAVETTDIPYDSDAAGLKTILDAMGIGTFAVAETGTNTWEITFQGALAGADQALFTYDQTGLSGPPIDGLLGGTYALKIIDDGTTHNVLGIPWNASNATIEEMVNDVMGVSEVAVTNGPLPATPARLTFGEKPLDVSVIPSLTVVSDDDDESLVSIVRSAQSASPKTNTWELTIIPGDGTPGTEAGAGTKLEPFTFTLRIDTPDGILSRKYDPHHNYDREAEEMLAMDDPDFKDEYQIRPNHCSLRFLRLDPRSIEQSINEAFNCDDIVRVTRIVHSWECKQFDTGMYGRGETENDIARVWYYRDVYRLTFVNEYADPSTIDSIQLIMPEIVTEDAPASGGLGGLFGGFVPEPDPEDEPDYGFRPIEPRDYMPIPAEAFNSVHPLGDPGNNSIQDDVAFHQYRTAVAFQLAWMAGDPISKHEIKRTLEDVDDHLVYRYNMQKLHLDSLANTSMARISAADLLAGGQIQFAWCTRRWLYEGKVRNYPEYKLLSVTEYLDWDATADQIKVAVGGLFRDLSNNDVFPKADGIEVTGSLFNSWLPDPYQGYGDVTPSTEHSGDQYNALEIKFVGEWARQPFNDYEYALVCLYRNNYPWIPYRKGDDQIDALATQVEQALSASAQYHARNPTIWMDEISKPLLPRRAQRIRINTHELEDDNITLFIGFDEFVIPRSSTAAQFEANLNAVYGSDFYIAQARSLVWDDDSKQWVTEWKPIGEDGFEWVPFKYLKGVTAYGTALDTHAIEFEFTGKGYQYQDQTLPTLTSDIQQAAYVTVTEIQPGILGADEIQYLTISGSPISGDYELDYNGNDSGAIAYDADAAAIQTAIEGITGLTAGDVKVTGDNGVFVLTFDGPLIDPDLLTTQNSTMLADATASTSVVSNGGLGGSLTVMEAVKGSGPQFFDSPGNWSLGVLPSSEDDIVIDEAVQPILYGLDMAGSFVVASADGLYLDTERRRRFLVGQKVYVRAGSEVGDALPTGLAEGYYYIKESFTDATFSLSTTLGGARVVSTGTGTGNSRYELRDCTLSVNARFTGAQIGLPKRRGDELEYLPTYLQMGFTDVILGIGDGDGMSLVRIDCLDSQTAIEVITTAGSSIENIPTALFLTNNVDASITVRGGGSAGIAVYAGEDSEIGDVVIDAGGSLTLPTDSINGVLTAHGDLSTLHTGVAG